MTRRVLGPFNRVEGDLEVRIESAGGAVAAAFVNSPLYRGFEHILRGKHPLDALVYAPRICGICSVSQSLAAARVLAAAQGLRPVPNGRLASDLTLAVENISDHLSHFYLFFMPDFAKAVYARESWYGDVAARFRAMTGSAASAYLAAHAEFKHMLGLLAGKWPHTLAIQPGGSTRALQGQEIVRLLMILASFRKFLEAVVYGSPLEQFASIPSRSALDEWAQGSAGDLARFWRLSQALDLKVLGRAEDRFLSYGSFGEDDARLFRPGTYHHGRRADLNPAAITEDVSHSWLRQEEGPRHPFVGVTLPEVDRPGGYSWCKAPRLSGQVMEVGALARQVVDGQALALDLVEHEGGNVRSRVLGRFIEIARLIPAMEQWLKGLRPRDAFCETVAMPEEAEASGLVEAARGALGHWLRISKGHIFNYQIIAPTTWNFSPRDQDRKPGALEQALVGAPVRTGEDDPIAVQHIVRSFDPCMVCTVH